MTTTQETGGHFYKSLNLTDKLTTFFEKEGHLLTTDSLHSLQYHTFIGDGAIPSLTDAYRSTDGSEFLPFKNIGHTESTRIENTISRLVQELYSEERPLQTIQRSYAIGTSTIPIHIQYTVEGSDEEHSFFIKRPDSNRILGKYLYNLITGNQYDFWFNSDIFIEDDIPGTTLSYYDEEALLEHKNYVQELIRSSLHVELLGLGPDTAQPRNRLITTKHEIIFFDFNIMFEPQKRPFQLLDAYDLSALTGYEIRQTYQEEHDAIIQQISEHAQELEVLCDVTKDLFDHMYMSVTQRIRRYYGSSDLKTYLLSHLNYCTECIHDFFD